ncbi:unnamed protein product, partial [Polarella glacialis]
YLADICTSGGALREQRREGSVLPCGPASPARSPSTEFGALLSEFRLLLNSNINNNNNSNKKSWLSKFKPFLLQPAANRVLRLSVSGGLHVHSARHCELGPGLLMKLSFASPALHLSSQRCLTALNQVSERLVGSCRCRQRQKLATKPLSQFKTGCDLDDAALLSSTAAHYAQRARAHVVAVKFSSSKANFRNGDAVVAKSRVKPACWQLFLHHGPSYRVQPVQGVTPDAATMGLPMHHLWSHCHLAALLQGGGPAGKTASLKAHQATHVPSVLSAHQATQLLSCPLSFHSPVQEGFKLQGRFSRLQVRWVETATPTTTTPSTAGYSLAREGASAWAGQTRSRSIIPSLRAAKSQCWALRAAPRNEFFGRRCPTFAKSPVRSQSLSTQNELLDHTPIVRCQTLCKAGAQDLLKESFGTNDSIAESAVRQSCSKSQAGFCSGHPSQICLSIPMAFSSPNIPVRKHVIMGPRSSTSRTMPHLCDRTCCQQPARALNWSLGMSPGRNYSPACVLGLNRDATCPCISGASLHATCSGPAMLCKHSLLSKVVKVASLLPQASPVTTTTTALPAHNSSWMLDCLTFVTHAVAVHICGSHRKAVKGASFLSVDPLVAACPPKQMSISAPQRLVVRGQVVSRRRSGGISSTSGSCKASWCLPPPPCSPTGLVPLDSKVFVGQSLGKAASAAFQLAREPAFRLAREAPVARLCLRKLPTVPTQGRQPVCMSGGRKCSVPAPPTTPPSPWMHSLELILLTPDMHDHDVAMVSSASEACYEVASIADFTLQGTLRDFKVCSNSGGPVGALKHLGGSSYKRLSLLPQDPTRTRLPGQTTNFCQAARTFAVAYELQDPSTFLPLAFSYARITELPAVTSSLPVVALQSTPWLLQPPASMLCGVGPKLTGADCARAQGSKWAGIDAWACLLKQQVVKNNSNTNNNHCTLSRARMVQVSDQFSLRRSSCAAEVAAKALLSSRRSPLSSQQVSSRHLEIRGSSMTTTTTAKAVVVAGRCKSQKYLLQDLTSCLQSDFAHDAGLAVSEECKQLPALIKVYHRGCATARLIIKEVSIKKAPQIAAPVMPASHPCATRASVQQVTLALNCGKRSLAVKSPCRCLLPCHGGAATCCPGSKQLLTHAQGIFASTRSSATPVLCHLLSERLDTLPSAHAARVAHLHFRWAPISGVIEKTAENRAVRVRPCSVAPTCRVPLFSQVTRSYSCEVTGLSSRLLSGTRQLLLPSGTSRLLLPQASCARKITTTAATTTRKPILASGRMQARGMLLLTFAARFQVVVKSPTPTTTATTTTATTTMSAEASRAPPKPLRSARFVAGFLGKQLQCSGQSNNKLQCSGKQLQCRDRNVHDNNIKLCLAMHLQPLPLLAASSFSTAIPSVRCNNREVQQQLKSSSRCLINVVPDMPLRCRSSSTSAGLTCALGRESRHSALGRSIGHASFVIAAPLQVRLALSGLMCSSSLATSWASAGRQLGSGSGLTITARAAQLPLGPRHGRAALPRVITPSHLAELAHDAGLASLGEGVRRQGWPAAGECKQSPLATRIRAAAATAAGGECTRAVRFSQRGCGKRAREVGTIFSCISQASSSLCRSSTGRVNLSYLPGPLVPGALQQATRDGCSRLCASSSGTTTTGTAIATTMAVSSFEVTVRTATDEGADAQDNFVLPGTSLVSLETWKRLNAMVGQHLRIQRQQQQRPAKNGSLTSTSSMPPCSWACLDALPISDKLSAKGHFLAVEHSLQSADLAHDAGLATSEERSQRPRAWRGGQVQKCPATKSVQSASSEDGPEIAAKVAPFACRPRGNNNKAQQVLKWLPLHSKTCFPTCTLRSVFCKSGSSVEEAPATPSQQPTAAFSMPQVNLLLVHVVQPLLALPACSKAALQHAGELFAAASCADGVTEQTRHGKALMLVKDGQVFSSQAVAEAWPDGRKPASTHAAKGRILTFLLEEAFHDGLHPKLLRRSSEDRVRFEKSVAFSPQLLRVHSAAQVSTSRVFSLRSLGSSSCALRPRVVESSPEAQYLCSLPTRSAALSLPALQACGAKSRGFSCSCTGAGSSMACGGQGGQQVHCFSHLTTSLLQSPWPAVIASESADAQRDIGSEMTFCFLILSRWFPALGLSSSDPCHGKDAVHGFSCWKRTVPALSSVFSQKRVPSVGTLRMSGDLAKSLSFRFSSTAPGVVRLARTGHCHQKVRCVHKLSASLLAKPLFILSDKQINFRPTTTSTPTMEEVLFCLLISSNWAWQACSWFQPHPKFGGVPCRRTELALSSAFSQKCVHFSCTAPGLSNVRLACTSHCQQKMPCVYNLSASLVAQPLFILSDKQISFQTTATSPLTVEEVLICLFISSSWALNSSQPSFTRRPLPSICMPLCEEHSCSCIQAAARGIGTQKFEARIIAAGASRNYSHHLQTRNGPANGASSGRCMHEVWVAPQQAYRVPPMTELALPSAFSQKRVHSLGTAPGVSNVRLACTSHCQQKVPCVYKFSAYLLAKPLFVLNDKQISFGPTTNSAITIEEVLICLFISSNWAVNSFQASYAVHRFGASSARSPVQNLAYVAHVDRPRFRRIRSGMPVPSISTPFSLNPSLHGSPAGSFLDCVPAEARGIETLKFKAQAQLLASVDQSKLRLTHQVGSIWFQPAQERQLHHRLLVSGEKLMKLAAPLGGGCLVESNLHQSAYILGSTSPLKSASSASTGSFCRGNFRCSTSSMYFLASEGSEAETNSTPASPACDPDAVLKKQRTLSLQRSLAAWCSVQLGSALRATCTFEYTRRPQLTRAMQKPAAADATKTTSAACAIAEKKVLLGIMPRTAAHVHRCFSAERACSTGEIASSMLLLASEFEPMTCNETKTLSGIPTSALTPRKLVATVSCQGREILAQTTSSLQLAVPLYALLSFASALAGKAAHLLSLECFFTQATSTASCGVLLCGLMPDAAAAQDQGFFAQTVQRSGEVDWFSATCSSKPSLQACLRAVLSYVAWCSSTEPTFSATVTHGWAKLLTYQPDSGSPGMWCCARPRPAKCHFVMKKARAELSLAAAPQSKLLGFNSLALLQMSGADSDEPLKAAATNSGLRVPLVQLALVPASPSEDSASARLEMATALAPCPLVLLRGAPEQLDRRAVFLQQRRAPRAGQATPSQVDIIMLDFSCSLQAGVLAPHISRPVPVVVASGDVLQEVSTAQVQLRRPGLWCPACHASAAAALSHLSRTHDGGFSGFQVACHEALDQCRRQLVVPQCSQWLLRVAPVTSMAKAEAILSSCSLRSHVQWKQLGRSGNQLVAVPRAVLLDGNCSLQAALGCQKQLGVGQHSSRWQMAMPPKVGAEVDVMLRVVLREGPNHMARHLKSLKACKPPQVSEMHRPGGCSMAAAPGVAAGKSFSLAARSMSANKMLGSICSCLPTRNTAEHDLALLEASCTLAPRGCGQFPFNVQKGKVGLATQEEVLTPSAAATMRPCSVSGRAAPFTSALSSNLFRVAVEQIRLPSNLFQIGVQAAARERRGALAVTPAGSSGAFKSSACDHFLRAPFSVQFQRSSLPNGLSMIGAVRFGEERASQDFQSVVPCRLGLHARWIAHSMDDKQASSPPSQRHELHSRLWQARIFGWQRVQGFDATQRILVDSSMMARHGCCMVGHLIGYFGQPQAARTQSQGRAVAASPVVAASTHAASAKSLSPRDKLGLRSQMPLGCCLPMHDAAEHDLALLEVNSSLVSTGGGGFRGCYGAFNVQKGRACLATQEAPNEGAATITKRCSFSARSMPCKSSSGFLQIGMQSSAHQMRRAVAGTPAESSRTESRACGQFLLVSSSAQFQRTWLPIDLSMTGAVRCGEERASQDCHSLVSCRLGLHARWIAHSMDDEQSSSPPQGHELHRRLWPARIFGRQRLQGFDATQRILVDSSMMARHGCCMVGRHRICSGTSEPAASKLRALRRPQGTHFRTQPKDIASATNSVSASALSGREEASKRIARILSPWKQVLSQRKQVLSQRKPHRSCERKSARSMPCTSSSCSFFRIEVPAAARERRGALAVTSAVAFSKEIAPRSRTEASACGHFLPVQFRAHFLGSTIPSGLSVTKANHILQSLVSCRLGLHAQCVAHSKDDKQSVSAPSQGRELHSRLWQARVFGVQRLRGFDATQRILVDSSMMARHGCCMVQRHRIYSGLQDKAELQMLCYSRQPQAKHTQSPGRFCALAASPVVAASTHAASAKSFSPRDNLGLRSQLPPGCCLPMHGAAEHDLALLEVNSSLVSTGRGEFRGCYSVFNVRKGRACLATQEAPNEGAANITKRCSISARSKPCKSGCGFLWIGTQASARQMRRAVGGTPAESSRIESRACGQFLLDSTSAQFQRTCLPTDLSMTAAVRCGGERASHNLQSLVSCRLGLHAQCVAHSKDDKQSGSAPSQGRELHSRLWQARVFGVQRLRGFDATQRILVDSSMMARHGCCMVQRHRIYSGLQDKAELQMLCYTRQPQAKHTQSPGRFCALAASPVVAASTHAASAKSFSPRDNLGLRSQLPLGCCLPMHGAAEHDLALLEVNSSLVSTGRGEFRGCYGAFNVRKGRACLATQEAPNEGAANITKRCSFSARSKPCKSGCGFLWIGTQASARQMRRAVGGTPAESTLAVSMEITHRSRTVLSACGHFLQVQFLRELDPSCRAATDSVSPVQSGMPLAQFLGLHAPCGAIQEAEKRSSLAHLQMPCSDRRHIATKTGQQKMCGAPWCFPRRVVPSATWQLQSVASLARTAKPLLLPIGASRIQQPTDKKMRAAFCKLTSRLSASSLEDLGLMELPSAHKKDMSVVRCGSFLPAAVDASREGLAKSSRGRAFQQPFRLPCLRLRCLKLAPQPQQEQQQCKLDCKPHLQLARRAGSLLPTRNCPTFQLDNSMRVPCGRAHGLRLVCVVSSRGQLQGASLCALSASWDLQTLVRCEKRDSILQSSLVRTCQNFVTSLPAASSNSSVLVCSRSQRSGHQSAAAECLLRCVTVEQDTALTVAGTVHLGSGSTKLHAAFCNLDAATRGPMQAVTALGQSLDFWPLRASGGNRMAKMLVHCATLHSSTVIAATSTCAMQAEGGGNCQQKECNRSPRSACALAPTSYLPSFPASFLREALKCQDSNLQAISEPRCQVIRRVRSTPSSVMRELPCYLAPRPRATFSSVLECDDDSALTTSELWRSKVPARADEQKTGVALCTMSAACSQIPLGRLTLPRPP